MNSGALVPAEQREKKRGKKGGGIEIENWPESLTPVALPELSHRFY